MKKVVWLLLLIISLNSYGYESFTEDEQKTEDITELNRFTALFDKADLVFSSTNESLNFIEAYRIDIEILNTHTEMEKNKDFLKVSEKFFSIQGEGMTVGYPAIFLRLGGCNLLCKSDDWICDSIAVWSKSKKVAFKDMFDNAEVKNLKKGVHLIITGGEPMLHQKQIWRYLMWFEDQYNFLPTIEIETNGTIVPTDSFYSVVKHWNVSPKLGNSGEPYKKRFVSKALHFFNNSSKVNWKFVIAKEEDVNEFLADYNFIELDRRMSFMPAGDSLESFAKTDQLVVEACKDLNIRFCPRLQISIYNQATGV
jgi:7-carboxy-7-deazaguanine synthase